MDEMTQQNAALVEEASAASETMTEQAKNMLDLVGFFKVASGSDLHSSPMTAPVNMNHGGQGSRPSAPAPSSMSHKPSPASRPVVKDDDDDWQEF
jgi:methyl-accepting chemotaxis protein